MRCPTRWPLHSGCMAWSVGCGTCCVPNRRFLHRRMPNLAKLRYASPRSSSLAEDLRQAAHDHLQASGDHRFADANLVAKGAFLVLVSALLYGVMVTAKSTIIFVL